MRTAAAAAGTEPTTAFRACSILFSQRLVAGALALLLLSQAAIAQPPCPATEPVSDQGEMRFTVQERRGQRPVLIADGIIDENAGSRLEAALQIAKEY